MGSYTLPGGGIQFIVWSIVEHTGAVGVRGINNNTN